jgi:CheY-like chemotaxis protein
MGSFYHKLTQFYPDSWISPQGNAILIVDDDPRLRQTVKELLSDMGYSVIVAADRKEALTLIDKEPYQVALLDMRLPDVRGQASEDEGFRLLDELLGRYPDRPVIFMTAYTSRDTIIEAMRLGAYFYLDKEQGFFKELPVVLGRALAGLTMERQAAMNDGQKRAEAVGLLERAKQETDANAKGRHLEELALLIFADVEGFRPLPRVRGNADEVDIVVVNSRDDGFWRAEGKYLLVECRNRKKKAEPKDINDFRTKMATRYRTQLGFFSACRASPPGSPPTWTKTALARR